MLSIRLSRVGKKKQPHFRVVVQEKSRDPYGKAVEILGFYNPRTKPKTIKFNEERIKYWLSQGAQCTPSAHNLLVDQKIIEAGKVKATKQKKGKKSKGGEGGKKDEQGSSVSSVKLDKGTEDRPVKEAESEGSGKKTELGEVEENKEKALKEESA